MTSIAAVKTAGARCWECPLRECNGVRGRFAIGSYRCRVAIVGEAPGRQEMIDSKVLIGPSGQLLGKTVQKAGLEDIWLTNAALCYAEDPKLKLPAARCCQGRLELELAEKKPRLIIAMGNIPTEILLGKGEGITARRGSIEQRGQYLILPTFHPAFILRNGNALPEFEADLQKAAELIQALTKGQSTEDIVRSVQEGAELHYEVTTDYEPLLRRAAQAPWAVIDLETTGLDLSEASIVCAVIAIAGEQEVYILPCSVVYDPGFAALLCNLPIRWSGHNAKFDRNMLAANLGVHLTFAHDSLLGNYVMDERTGRQGLKVIARAMWNAPDWEAPLRETMKANKLKNYGQLPPDILHKYAAYDGHYQRMLTEYNEEQLSHARGQLWVYENLLMPGMHALSEAEIKGVAVNRELFAELERDYTAQLEQVQQRLERIAGHDFNPRSTQQVAVILFDELKQRQIDGRSTAAKTVLHAYEDPHPFVVELLEYRRLNTLLTRYVVGMQDFISPAGRLHTSFNLFGTTSGRLSSSDPNLQNLPRDNKDIKKLLIPDLGNLWIECDFSQIELRVIAWLSQDPYLLESYRQGRDLHGSMAEYLFGEGYTKEQRSLAKTLNFLLVYGGSPEAIIRALQDKGTKIDMEEATRIHRAYFTRMPRIMPWVFETHKEATRTHQVVTPLGRVRHFPELELSRSRSERERTLREAVNNTPQSVASDLTLYSLIQLWKRGYDVRLTVHDSVVTQAPANVAFEAAKEQCHIMEESAMELLHHEIPIVAEASIGPSWGEVKEIIS